MTRTCNEQTSPTSAARASPVQMADACYAILRAQLNSPPCVGNLPIVRARCVKAACIRLRPQKSGEKMSNVDFTTSANPEILATEVACLKATLTLILKSIGQADAGKVIINMERSSPRLKIRLRRKSSRTAFSKSSTLTASKRCRSDPRFMRVCFSPHYAIRH